MQTIELSLRGHLWPIAAIVLTCFIAARGGNLGGRHLMDAQFSSQRFPVAAVNYTEAHQVQGPIASPDYWGGYLIYRLYPQTKVAGDDRHDFYGEAFLKAYLKMIHLEPGWEEFLEHYGPGSVIVPKDSPLANMLAETTRWQPIYNDDVAVVFIRNPAKNK